jgi:hypothetical protein
MSHLGSFSVACAFVVTVTLGCGGSQPATAPAGGQIPPTAASTNLGSADYQANAANNQTGQPASPATVSSPVVTSPTVGPAMVSPPSVGPSTVSPPTVGPVASGQPGSGTAINIAAPTGQPAKTAPPTVNGPAVSGAVATVPPAGAPAASASPGTTVASAVPAPTTGATNAAPAAAAMPGANKTSSLNLGTVPAGALPSGDMRGLAAAVNQWRLQGTNLAGVKRFEDKPVGAGYSWMTYLLPYVGYNDLYSKFDFTQGWHKKENLPLACEVIPAFLDPANPNHNERIFTIKNAIGPAFTHFVGMAGVEDSRNVVAAALPRSDPRAGIFGYDQIARPEEITDGATNTIMMISSGKIIGPWAAGGGATVRGARAPYFDAITGFGTASDPGGGALVAMADGSVKRISKDIDPAVFRALCTIHGGESIDMAANANVIRSP